MNLKKMRPETLLKLCLISIKLWLNKWKLASMKITTTMSSLADQQHLWKRKWDWAFKYYHARCVVYTYNTGSNCSGPS